MRKNKHGKTIHSMYYTCAHSFIMRVHIHVAHYIYLECLSVRARPLSVRCIEIKWVIQKFISVPKYIFTYITIYFFMHVVCTYTMYTISTPIHRTHFIALILNILLCVKQLHVILCNKLKSVINERKKNNRFIIVIVYSKVHSCIHRLIKFFTSFGCILFDNCSFIMIKIRCIECN